MTNEIVRSVTAGWYSFAAHYMLDYLLVDGSASREVVKQTSVVQLLFVLDFAVLLLDHSWRTSGTVSRVI